MPPALSRQLADFAGRKRVSQASVVEAAIASFLSPDGSERLEAAFSRRLDRISRQIDKLDYHVEVGNEAFALYLRRWLEVTPALGAGASAAARADAEKRFSHLVEALARRMETGKHLSDELIRREPQHDEAENGQ
nr:CopG family transcriptional regulator [Qipengyuania citrea]